MTQWVAGPKRLEGIHPRTWEHPADRAALAAMQSLPGFDEIIKKLAGMFGDRGVRLAFQGDAVRVTNLQFPRVHRIWLRTLSTLDADREYQLYVTQTPTVNAGAFGIDVPFVVLNSGMLRLLDDDEIEAVLGHELGHVLSGHALYHTMLVLLFQIAAAGVPMLGIAFLPVLMALNEWYRKSELSADRAGLLAVQQPDVSLAAMMRMAGGGTRDEMNLREFLAQAEEYRDADSVPEQVIKLLNTLFRSHDYLAMRAMRLRQWIEDGAYDRVMRGEYPKRGDAEPSTTEDVAAGVRHYTDNLADVAKGAGDALRRMREAWDRGFQRSEGQT